MRAMFCYQFRTTDRSKISMSTAKLLKLRSKVMNLLKESFAKNIVVISPVATQR